MTMALQLRRRSPAETRDLNGIHSLVGCIECDAALGKGWPYWGIHLTVALNYHAAHWLVTETRDIPVIGPDESRSGAKLGIVHDQPPCDES